MGFIIEKEMLHGRKVLASKGITRIESLAIVDSLENNIIHIKDVNDIWSREAFEAYEATFPANDKLCLPVHQVANLSLLYHIGHLKHLAHDSYSKP